MSDSFEVALAPDECLDRIGVFIATDPGARGTWASVRDGCGRVDVVSRWPSGMKLREQGAGTFTVDIEPAPNGSRVTVRSPLITRLFGGKKTWIASLVRDALGLSGR